MNETIKPIVKFFIDIFCAFLALSLSYIFLYNLEFVSKNLIDIFYPFLLFSIAYFLSSFFTKNYASVWAYASLNEIFRLAITISLSFIILFLVAFFFSFGLNTKALFLFYLLLSFFAANSIPLMMTVDQIMVCHQMMLKGSSISWGWVIV